VALQAKRAHVGKIAFASTFGHGHDVVGIPEVAPAAPVLFELAASRVVQLTLVPAQRFGVQAASRADAVVAQEDLFAQVTGIGAQFPFVDACLRAKREASLGNFALAPAAWLAAAIHKSAGLDAAGAHSRRS
jgi:hypothetical protein